MSKTPNLLEKLKTCIVVILGLGKEGLSSYEFLRKNFPNKKLLLLDEKPLNELSEKWQEISRNDDNIEFTTQFADFSDEFEKNLESAVNLNKENHLLVIKSPGITPAHPLVEQAKNLVVRFDEKSQKIKTKITSNTNIFLRFLKNNQENLGNIKTIGVTGTKGKSTTSSMIHHVLKGCGIESFLGGNIGTPPLSLLEEILSNTEKNSQANENKNQNSKLRTIVLEMSSHQLSDAMISPSIAVILDIEPEHLDYYNSFEEYVEAKSQISRFQTEQDLVIFDDNNEIPTKLANLGKAKQITFSQEKNVVEGSIFYKSNPTENSIKEKIIETDQLPVLGKHNILNTIPSIIIAKQLGCKTEDIQKSLSTFKTLPHRLEIVYRSNGITYVNDSLSTAPKSAIAAMNSFGDSPIILIAGGHERNLKFLKLAEAIVNRNVKHLILFPTTGEKILKEVRSLEESRVSEHTSKTNHTFANSMQEAVETAKSVAKPGDVVLLSPASASFGLFKNYQDRGDQFRELVEK